MVTTKSFPCATCDINFDSPAGLGQHVAVAHRECVACGETFDTTDDLDEHTQSKH